MYKVHKFVVDSPYRSLEQFLNGLHGEIISVMCIEHSVVNSYTKYEVVTRELQHPERNYSCEL